MRRSTFTLWIIAACVIAAAALTSIIVFAWPRAEMLRTGQVEMRQIDVASKVPGRLTAVRVDEGDTVTAGEELFRLSDREVRAKSGQAQGAVDAARAQYDMAVHGARPEQVEMAERQYAAASGQYALAEKTWRRMKALHADSLLSDQEFDAIEQKYTSAKDAMEAARAQRDMARKGARAEEIAMARGQYDRASQALEESRAYVDETAVAAPQGGIVAKRYADPGELVSTGYPVLSLIDPRDAWVELNLPAPELERIAIGRVLAGTVHGTGRTLRFRVTSIAAMADVANWRAQNERGTYDVRTFTMRMVPLDTDPGMRPGMTVTFDLSAQK